jgi:hypothetical protein
MTDSIHPSRVTLSHLNWKQTINSTKGDAVSIYGTTGPNNSQYSVQRPGRPPQELTATRDIAASNVLLYFGDQFGAGNHTITLVNEAPGLFQIDYAVVHTAADTAALTAASTRCVGILCLAPIDQAQFNLCVAGHLHPRIMGHPISVTVQTTTHGFRTASPPASAYMR